MPSSSKGSWLRAPAAMATLAILILAAVFAGRAGLSGGTWGLLTVAGGSVALLVLGFPLSDLVAALRHGAGRFDPGRDHRRSARVWKAAARNAWVLGAMGATTVYVAHLCWGFTEIHQFVTGLGDVAVSLICGLGLAALLHLPALRLSQDPGGADLPSTPSPSEPGAPLVWGRLPAYGLLALLATWPLLASPPSPQFPPADWLLHWPAILVVGGGGLALALYLGCPRNGEALTLGLASAGVVAVLLGLTQGLRGFAGGSIELVTAGLTFAISACVVSLLGLAAFGLPMQDRARGSRDEAPSVASRVAAYGFPIVVLACLIVTTLMVLTPMKRKMPHPDEPGTASEAPVGGLESTDPPGLG